MNSSASKDEMTDPTVALKLAVKEAIDHKRRLGQYWVEWDGEKPVKIYPEGPTDTAAE
ncbi:hypothetical protein [Asticcacaulis benevestitus]|uniref:Uncharacterized protein n=1 Tax=Asticcacaulis benevestitus DSM 16100 = ATCC BAA-896 TaxID=1121022 RepID=V4Q8J0_9CAUL|nr:hypothetical protein [Asticcacaulis benevestitus]ESQ94140.1 hypothetical protein ABENE_03350 [Asticcacaulis benevestitus DSM 16100 = ATCC BAA-896]